MRPVIIIIVVVVITSNIVAGADAVASSEAGWRCQLTRSDIKERR